MKYSHQGILYIHFRKCFRAPDFHGVVLRKKGKLQKVCKISHFVKQQLQNSYMYMYVCLKNMEEYVQGSNLELAGGAKINDLM